MPGSNRLDGVFAHGVNAIMRAADDCVTFDSYVRLIKRIEDAVNLSEEQQAPDFAIHDSIKIILEDRDEGY